MALHEEAEKLNRVTEWDGDDALCEWCSQNEATLAIDGEPVCLPCRLDEVERELADTKFHFRQASDQVVSLEEEIEGVERERDEVRARVEELEAAIDSQHAEVGHNIWRFWRDKARETAEKNTLLRARVAAAYEEAAEAANLVPNQAHPADYDALDRIRAKERERCARIADSHHDPEDTSGNEDFDAGYDAAAKAIAAAIREDKT